MSPFVAAADARMMDFASRFVRSSERLAGVNKFGVLREMTTARFLLALLALLAVDYSTMGFWKAAFVCLAVVRIPVGIARWRTLDGRARDLETVRGFEREMKRLGKLAARHREDAWVTVPLTWGMIASFLLLTSSLLAFHGVHGMGVPMSLWSFGIVLGHLAYYVDMQPPAAPGARRGSRLRGMHVAVAAGR